jgi:carbon monoxide dehydrogenase subunit G
MAIELDNTFTVPVTPDRAWDVLLDVERITPCMPGATVESVSEDGNVISASVKVKLGPLSLTYKGTAKFIDKDKANNSMTIEATGKETRGAGTASANVQVSLKPGDADGSTLVSIHTSMNVTGRPAQFGRSLLPEVSGKLIAQFASNLEALIQADNSSAAAPAGEETASPESDGAGSSAGVAGSSVASAAPAPALKQEESLNAFTFVVVPILKRVLPIAAVGAAIAVVIRKLTGKSKKGA